MDAQSIINLVGLVGIPLFLGLLTYFNGKISKLEKEHTDFRVKVAEEYVTHHETTRIYDALERIEQKLDSKADKNTK